MAKKRHSWHCGRCNGDLKATKGAKGTKYLYCPSCAQQVAYFNVLPLIAGAALRYAAPSLLQKGGEILGITEKTTSPSGESPKCSDSGTTRAERIVNRELYGV